MNRAHVRKVFLVVFGALLLQYGLVGYGTATDVGEPWPAVVLPGFKNVWDSSTTIGIPSAEFEVRFADGTVSSMLPAQVFSSIPASHHLGIMRTHFAGAGGATAARISAEKAAWLRGRVEEIFGKPASRVEVIWSELRLEPGSRTPGRVAVDTLVIDLP